MLSVHIQALAVPGSAIVAAARTSRKLALATYETSSVTLLDADTGASRVLQLAQPRINGLALSADGTRLAIGCGAVSLWSAAGDSPEWEAALSGRAAGALCFVDDERLVAAFGPAVHQLDLSTRTWRETPVFMQRGRRPLEVWTLAASADGKLVAAGTISLNRKPSMVSVFELATGKIVAELQMKRTLCRALAFSADGTQLLVADGAGVRAFDAATWKATGVMFAAPPEAPVAFTSDGRTAFVDDERGLSRIDFGRERRTARTVSAAAVGAAIAIAAPGDRFVRFMQDGTATILTSEELAEASRARAAPAHPLAAQPSVSQGALVAGRIVNEAGESSRSAVARATYALVARWRERLGVPLVAVEAPCRNTFDRSAEPYESDDEPTVFPICVGLLVDRATADEGPHRLGSLPELRDAIERARTTLGELFWSELQGVLDALVRRPFDGYGGDRELWRRDTGIALSPALSMHLVALPYDTTARLAFGVLRSSADERVAWIQGNDDQHEPHARGVAGVLVCSTNADGAYTKPIDLSDTAAAAHRAGLETISGRPAYYLVASNVAG